MSNNDDFLGGGSSAPAVKFTNPGDMVRGTVTYGWARKHHPKWFEEVMKKGDSGH